jgi:hypothetical protein
MYVCPDCLGDDYALREFVQANAVSSKCDYCGVDANHPIAADFDKVSDLIMESVHREWTHAGNELGWAHEEGGWIGEYYDSYDLLEKIELNIENAALRDHVLEALGDQDWCRISGYGDPVNAKYRFGWQAFSDRVKHQTRYVFFRVIENEHPHSRESIPPHKCKVNWRRSFSQPLIVLGTGNKSFAFDLDV